MVEGNRLGRTIGYPTANLRIDGGDLNPQLLPGDGVYAVEVIDSGEERIQRRVLSGKSADPGSYRLQGMMNIGLRPTVDGSHRVIEVNIFDFNDSTSIYGQTLQVFAEVKISPGGEQKFGGLEALEGTVVPATKRIGPEAGAFFAGA